MHAIGAMQHATHDASVATLCVRPRSRGESAAGGPAVGQGFLRAGGAQKMDTTAAYIPTETPATPLQLACVPFCLSLSLSLSLSVCVCLSLSLSLSLSL